MGFTRIAGQVKDQQHDVAQYVDAFSILSMKAQGLKVFSEVRDGSHVLPMVCFIFIAFVHLYERTKTSHFRKHHKS